MTWSITLRVHALQRMQLWEIHGTSLRAILEAGDTIESDLHDLPFPRRLVLGYDQRGPVHVAVCDDSAALK